MQSFQHVTPPLRLYQGEDCLRHLGRELERLDSRRALVVCGGTISRDPVLMEALRSAMGDRLIGVFAGVKPHSPAPAVEDAARELQRLEADAVIAVGGGSAIVTARAASILLAERGDLAALATSVDERGRLTSPKLLAPKLPQIIVPTTPTTAMVKAGSAVLDPIGHRRLALFDPKTRAQSIFVHPAFALSAPRDLVVGSALNSFTLALEGLTSRSGDPLADALLMHGVRLLARHLSGASLDEAAVRAELILASVLCGQGTDHTGAGMTTALGHIIGSRHHVDNGIVTAVVVPHALRFSAEVTQPGLAKIATALDAGGGEPLVETVIAAICRVFDALGTPRRLRDIGVPRDSLPGLAAGALGDWFLRGNPRPVRDAAELQRVLEAAW